MVVNHQIISWPRMAEVMVVAKHTYFQGDCRTIYIYVGNYGVFKILGEEKGMNIQYDYII